MKKPVGYYNYTVFPTYFGFALAILGIFLAMLGKPEFAVYCLVISGVCDMFDGKIARTRKRTDEEKHFGIEIDSLSDCVSFGVLPAVIGMAMGMTEWYFYPILLLYPLCALIRLGYFNVQEMCRQQTETGVRKSYVGLPVTVGSLFFAFLHLVGLALSLAASTMTWVWAIAMLVVAVLFVTPFTLPKPGTKGIIFWACFGAALIIAIIVISALRA